VIMTTHLMTWKLVVSTVALGIAAVFVVPATPGAVRQAQQPSEVSLVINGDSAGTPPKYAVPDFVALTPEAEIEGDTPDAAVRRILERVEVPEGIAGTAAERG